MARISHLRMLSICLLLGCIGYAAKGLYWRPVMPAVLIEAREGATRPASQLMMIYGEHGREPSHMGTLAADERIAGCAFLDGVCASSAARRELRLGFTRRQSLQVRRIDGRDNPIVGYVVWRGPAFPRTVKLSCDMGMSDVSGSCRITAVEA